MFRTKNPTEYCILLGHNGSRVGRVTTPRSVKFKFIALYAETLEGLEGEGEMRMELTWRIRKSRNQIQRDNFAAKHKEKQLL